MILDITHALTVEGWQNPVELLTLSYLAQGKSCIVEIGSWQGRSTSALAANTRGVVYAVDLWTGHGAPEWEFVPGTLESFVANTARYPNIIRVVSSSLAAAEHFGRAGIRPDLVWIDGDHSYESVSADIRAWKAVAAPGAQFAGHDYEGGANWPGVKRAVDELIPRFILCDKIWIEELA